MNCQSLNKDETRCKRQAKVRVKGVDPVSKMTTWDGDHCPKHARRVVDVQMFQAINGTYRIVIECIDRD